MKLLMEMAKKRREPEKPMKRRPSDDANDDEFQEFGTKVQIFSDPREFQRNKLSSSSPAGKVKFWDPTCSKEGDAQTPKSVTTTVVSQRKTLTLKSSNNINSSGGKMTSHGKNKFVNSKPFENNKLKSIISRKEQVRREEIKEAMAMFDEVYKKVSQDNRLKPKEEKIAHWRVPVEVAKIVKQNLKWVDAKRTLGPICGVQVGDKFKFRSQLQMIGLHFQLQSGIDFIKINGKNLAISIVNSNRYANGSEFSEILFYYGEGGFGFFGSKLPPEDQKLERGNLALKNSMDEKTLVRVIRKVNNVFVYDGLYIVKCYTQERSVKGKMTFKFQLNRVPGQPPLHKMVNASS